jgi:hypothetical protein
MYPAKNSKNVSGINIRFSDIIRIWESYVGYFGKPKQMIDPCESHGFALASCQSIFTFID